MGVADNVDGQTRVGAFRDGLLELGWRADQNVKIEYRWSAGDRQRARSYASELVASSPDVILADSTPAVIALLQETRTVPIVFVQVSDPVGSGLVSSLARPGGNVTGFTNFEFSIGGKWIELLREIDPSLRKVLVLFNPQTAPYGQQYVVAMEQAANLSAIEVVVASVGDASEIEKSIGALRGDANCALIVLPDIFTGTHHRQIVSAAAAGGILAVYPFPYFAVVGGLISYGIDQLDLFRRSASYVDRILRGVSPSELPVQQPIKFKLVININTARMLGVTVPLTLLARADEVIE